MCERIQPGLEVRPGTGPEIVAQPDANKYFLESGESKNLSSNRPIQSDPSEARNHDWRKAFWVLALIAVLGLAGALGAGLGAGLAGQHRSTPSSGPAASSLDISNSIFATTQSDKVVTITSEPSTPQITQSDKLLTMTSISSVPPTMPYRLCPAVDRSTYIATNKPSPTASPQLEITNASLAYEIFCYTNFIADPPVIDLQSITNVTSFLDCLDACALYSFQTKPVDFPAFACTGIAWQRVASATQFCWLKSNVTSSSTNATDIYPGIDGAVMVY